MITRIVCGICCLVAPAWTCFAQNAETLRYFDEGNTHYTAGEYQQAIAAYERAVDSGFASPEIYYNAGNAYYRIDELGKAVLYYKRAEKLSPDLGVLQHALVLTSDRLTDKFSRLPEPIWSKFWTTIFTNNLTKPLAMLGLLFYVLGFGIVSYGMWTRDGNQWIRRASTALLAVGLPLLVGGLISSFQQSSTRSAVVMSDAVALHEEPTEDSTSEVEIHEGLVVRIGAQAESWTMVTLPNGVSGWVLSETIQEI